MNVEVCTPTELATIRADAARMTWDRRHNIAMLACEYAAIIVRERKVAKEHIDAGERAFARRCARGFEVSVRRLADRLMIEQEG